MWWWSLYLWNEILIISAEDFFPLWRKYSLQQQNCFQLTFRNFPCYGSNGITVIFFCFMNLLTLLFVSLILTCLYLYAYPWSKSLPWPMYVIREKLWKLLKWTVSFGWKKINLRLTVSKDFNRSMLVEKIITHRKGPFKLRKWTKNKNLWSGSGLAGINRRDYGT